MEIHMLSTPHSILRRTMFIAIMATAAAVSSESLAQVPVTDSRVQQTTNSQLQELQKQLQQLQQITRSVTQLQQATGSMGQGAGSGGMGNIMGMISQGMGAISGAGGLGSLGNMNLSQLGGLGGIMSIVQSASNIVRQATQNGGAQTQPMQNSLSAFNNIIQGNMSGDQAMRALQSILYVNSNTAPTSQQVEAVNDMRRLNLQNAVSSALAIAMQVKGSIGQDGYGAINQIAQMAQGSQNLRQDMMTNTTALLKLAEQTTVQNGLLASLLHMEGAWQVSQDGINGRGIGR
jgi:uncharacterized alpha-E superfamily protein